MVVVIFFKSLETEKLVAIEDEVLWPKLLSCAEDKVLEVDISMA